MPPPVAMSQGLVVTRTGEAIAQHPEKGQCMVLPR